MPTVKISSQPTWLGDAHPRDTGSSARARVPKTDTITPPPVYRATVTALSDVSPWSAAIVVQPMRTDHVLVLGENDAPGVPERPLVVLVR